MNRMIVGIRAGIAAIAFAGFAAMAVPGHAFEIQEVTSDSGIKAWLVEDYTNPIITVAASFKGGAAQDPEGKAGMAALLSTLFDEGAGPYDSKEFQARLEEIGATLSFRDRRDRFTATLQTLRSDSPEAFDLMRLSLTDLRFADDSIERMRAALETSLLRSENRPRTKARLALRESLFPEHPYSRPTEGTVEELQSISRSDLVSQFGKLFARDNLEIGIVGAISPDEVSTMLDEVFGDLPQSASLDPIEEIEPELGENIRIEQDNPQSTIILAYPGVARDSDEFFAAYLMNHILGGGTFSSRLYDEVREKRGLAYSIDSDLSNYDHAHFLTISTATAADRADEALRIIRREVERMASEGPTQAELEAAKKYVTGAYAINNLDMSSNIARALVALQEEELGIDYIEEREALIDAVTLEEVRNIARELLSVEPTVIVVGPANG